MYAQLISETQQSEEPPVLTELLTQADVGLNDSIYVQNRTGRGHSTYDAESDSLILPKPGAPPRSLSPFQQLRGRLMSRTYVPSTREHREDSCGNQRAARSRSPLVEKIREGRKEMRRTKDSITKVLACQHDHSDVGKNWIVGGNLFGYYCKCKWCGCKLNDLIYWGPVNRITGENRYHGEEVNAGDDIENYPQDKRCCVCGTEGCHPVNCKKWQTYNKDGLELGLRSGRPPLAGSIDGSDKSNAGGSATESSAKGSPRPGVKRSPASETSARRKSPKTSNSEVGSDEGLKCARCGRSSIYFGEGASGACLCPDDQEANRTPASINARQAASSGKRAWLGPNAFFSPEWIFGWSGCGWGAK